MANLNRNRMSNNMPAKDSNTTLNHEGAVVHKLNLLEELYSRVVGSYMGESSYYVSKTAEDDAERIKEIVDQLPAEDAEYALKIAAIGRASNMISYPLTTLAVCYNNDNFKGDNFLDENGVNKMKGYSDKIIRRGKDITDILATQFALYPSTPLPKQERKNLKRALERFDEYQLAKALGKNRQVSMADAIKLLHPNCPAKAQFYKDVIENNVKFANGKKQVQATLSTVNNTNSKTTVKDVKASIADSSLMAIIKNLVGMYRAGAIDMESAKTIASKLTNPDIVHGSRILPYQMYDAYKAFTSNVRTNGAEYTIIRDALVKAVDLSCDNVDAIDGYSLIFVDLSGSMDYPVSQMSSTRGKEVAAVLAAVALKKSTATVYAFASRCERVDVSSASTVVDITKAILSKNVGGSTYLAAAMEAVSKYENNVDNVIVLTDGDSYSVSDHHGYGAPTFKNNRANGFHIGGYYGESCDDVVNKLIAKNKIKRIFINDLRGNDFAVVDTGDYRKNLVCGYSEKYIDSINFQILLGKASSDIRKIIDILYDKYYSTENTKPVKKGKKSR